MADCWPDVRVTRRSLASFGRMEIRFSCCASQLIAFMNRSRFPGTPIAALEAKSESPMPNTRVSGFGASAAGGVLLPDGAGGVAVAGAVAADARTIGPGLDRKSTRLNSSHMSESRMPSSA